MPGSNGHYWVKEHTALEGWEVYLGWYAEPSCLEYCECKEILPDIPPVSEDQKTKEIRA